MSSFGSSLGGSIRLSVVSLGLVMLIATGCSGGSTDDTPQAEQSERVLPESVQDFASIMGVGETGVCRMELDLGGDVSTLNNVWFGEGGVNGRVMAVGISGEHTVLLYRSNVEGGGLVEVGDRSGFILGFDSLRSTDPVWTDAAEGSWSINANVVGSGTRYGERTDVSVELKCAEHPR